jgi:hypothetical protein
VLTSPHQCPYCGNPAGYGWPGCCCQEAYYPSPTADQCPPAPVAPAVFTLKTYTAKEPQPVTIPAYAREAKRSRLRAFLQDAIEIAVIVLLFLAIYLIGDRTIDAVRPYYQAPEKSSE